LLIFIWISCPLENTSKSLRIISYRGCRARARVKSAQLAAATSLFSGDSRIKKVGGATAGPRQKVGGQHKCLSCMVIFHCFED